MIKPIVPCWKKLAFMIRNRLKGRVTKVSRAKSERQAGSSGAQRIASYQDMKGKRAVTKNSQVWKAKTSQESEQSKGGSSKSLKISNSHSLQEKSPGGKRTSVGHKRVGSDASTRIGSPQEVT
ncbi:hypothetical protein YC2023_041653 [Brassica napus]